MLHIWLQIQSNLTYAHYTSYAYTMQGSCPNKARHGGSIYDMLVQESKSLKLQQKLAPCQLADAQRNVSSYINKTTAEVKPSPNVERGAPTQHPLSPKPCQTATASAIQGSCPIIEISPNVEIGALTPHPLSPKPCQTGGPGTARTSGAAPHQD